MTKDLYNDEAEQTILGIMLVDNNRISSISCILNKDDFFSKENKLIYENILTLYRKNKPVDIVTLTEMMRFNDELDDIGGADYINSLADNVITTANYKNYCKIIIKYSKKRQLLTLFDKGIEDLEASTDVDDVAMKSKEVIENILINRTSDNMSHIINGLTGVMDQIEHIISSDDKLLGVSTGLKSLDDFISGLVGGRLYILGGRPAMGKSALAQQIAENVSKLPGKNVLIFSLEMGLDEYTQRSLFRRVGINQEMLSRGMVDNTIFDKIAQNAEEMTHMNLYIVDNSSVTLEDIESNIISCINSKGGCDLVVVDYLQLMGSSDNKEHDRFKIVSNNSTGLKKLARKYNVPILALCQLSRALESRADKRPILSDLRESGAIEQDADLVMFIYRDEVYEPRPDNRAKAELIIGKQRQGRIGTIDLLFEASRTTFKEPLSNKS